MKGIGEGGSIITAEYNVENNISDGSTFCGEFQIHYKIMIGSYLELMPDTGNIPKMLLLKFLNIFSIPMKWYRINQILFGWVKSTNKLIISNNNSSLWTIDS